MKHHLAVHMINRDRAFGVNRQIVNEMLNRIEGDYAEFKFNKDALKLTKVLLDVKIKTLKAMIPECHLETDLREKHVKLGHILTLQNEINALAEVFDGSIS